MRGALRGRAWGADRDAADDIPLTSSELRLVNDPPGGKPDNQHDEAPPRWRVDDRAAVLGSLLDDGRDGVGPGPQNTLRRNARRHRRVDEARLDQDGAGSGGRQPMRNALGQDAEPTFGGAVDVIRQGAANPPTPPPPPATPLP